MTFADESSEVSAEIDQETVNTCYDLCESIPGLYRLLDLCKDKGFKSISKIQFEQLNSCHVRLIGCYGRNDLIAKLLLTK
ncbi:8856_t:CDS:2, partial [Racocetra fulgida]